MCLLLYPAPWHNDNHLSSTFEEITPQSEAKSNLPWHQASAADPGNRQLPTAMTQPLSNPKSAALPHYTHPSTLTGFWCCCIMSERSLTQSDEEGIGHE